MTTKKKVTKKQATKAVKKVMSQPKLTTQDRKWRAEDDARALAQAEEVKLDKPRLEAAKKQARRIVKEQEKRLISIRKIASVEKEK